MFHLIVFACSSFLFNFILILPATSSPVESDCSKKSFDDAVNCCQLPPTPKQLDDIVNECEKLGHNETSIEKSGFQCLDHCILSKAVFLKEKEKLTLTAVRDYFAELLKDSPDWQETFKRTVPNCMPDDSHSHEIEEICKEPGLFQCLVRQDIMHCPTSAWHESKGCSELRECLVKDDQLIPPETSLMA